jgi:spore maturation protein CgeB
MTAVIVGDYITDIYELAILNAMLSLNVKAVRFGISDYFSDAIELDRPVSFHPTELVARIQKRYRTGPLLYRINRDLVSSVKKARPDLTFIYRCPYVFGDTMGELKRYSKALFVYNNDDPFSPNYPKYFWRHHFAGLPHCDHIFCFRSKNLNEYRSLGYSNTSILLPYYVRAKHHYISEKSENKYSCDVLFAGHFEPDGRDDIILRILESGIDVKLFGTEWTSSKHYKTFCNTFGRIAPLREDYNLALNSTKIALVFLSKVNHDVVTTRTFEIPATRTFMMSEYSAEGEQYFKKGVEAEYFQTPNELIDKLTFYLQNAEVREKIARAGYAKLIHDGHEATDRAKQILATFNWIQER